MARVAREAEIIKCQYQFYQKRKMYEGKARAAMVKSRNRIRQLREEK